MCSTMISDAALSDTTTCCMITSLYDLIASDIQPIVDLANGDLGAAAWDYLSTSNSTWAADGSKVEQEIMVRLSAFAFCFSAHGVLMACGILLMNRALTPLADFSRGVPASCRHLQHLYLSGIASRYGLPQAQAHESAYAVSKHTSQTCLPSVAALSIAYPNIGTVPSLV